MQQPQLQLPFQHELSMLPTDGGLSDEPGVREYNLLMVCVSGMLRDTFDLLPAVPDGDLPG